MRWPRMTTRRWMVAVAAIGLLLVCGPELLKFTPRGQRRLEAAATYTRQAQFRRRLAQQYETEARAAERGLAQLRWRKETGYTSIDSSRMEEYEVRISTALDLATVVAREATLLEEMSRTNAVAARRIWEPDPPVLYPWPD